MAAKGEAQENGSGSETSFCLDDYDCFGFDMDHTVVQYHLEAIFKVSNINNFIDFCKFLEVLMKEETFRSGSYFGLNWPPLPVKPMFHGHGQNIILFSDLKFQYILQASRV